jgi:hypothetical protein
MPQLVVVDSRLPPSSAPADDPTNPLRAMKDLKSLENQATADTKYDIQAKLREGFSVSPHRKMFAILAGIAVALMILIYPQPLYIRVILGVGVIYAIHYIIGMGFKNTAI